MAEFDPAGSRRLPPADRFSGCLIGQCLGDALGFVVEGYPSAQCAEYVESYLRAGRAGEIGRGGYRFGQYTDDSQLARELMASYLDRGGFDPADYARRIAALFSDERIVGRGRTTEAAALKIMAGVPWQEAATPPPNAGNGSAMRAGPVGLMFHDDAPALDVAAQVQSRITHGDPRCAAGAVAIAGAVAMALGPAPLEPARVIETLAARTEAIEPGFAAELRRLADWLELEPAEAGPVIARAGLQPGFSDRWDGISPFVTSSVIWSLYCFLRTPDDYWETICTAIAVGGDVDTTAAMAGAISGAYLGLAAVPAGLAARLSDQGRWELDELLALAEGCHALATGAAAGRPGGRIQ